MFEERNEIIEIEGFFVNNIKAKKQKNTIINLHNENKILKIKKTSIRKQKKK